MAWTFVGVSTSVEATATGHTLTVPAGVAAGDLLVACISSRIASTTSIALPAGGWTLVGEQKANNILSTSSALPSAMMAYCVRGASNPNLVFTHPTAPSVALGRIVAYRGGARPTASAKDTETSFTTAIGTLAVSGTGLTTTQDDDLIVAMAAGGQEAAWSAFNATTPAGASGATDTTTAPSATWRERAEQVTTTGVDTSLGIFDALKTAAGATGNLTVTASVAAGHAIVAGAFKIGPPSTADAWNVNDSTEFIALSNSDKTATASASSTGIRSTTTHLNGAAGKYYAEVFNRTTRFGITPTSNTLIATTLNMNIQSNGTININSAAVGSVGGSIFATDVTCIAWDAGAELLWVRLNGGLWNNDAAANPATGTNGLDASFAAATAHALWATFLNAQIITLRTELAEFTQAVPSGFTSWMGETPAAAEGLLGVWTGSAWVEKPMKIWTGSAWVQKPLKRWSGSAWI